MYVERGVKLFCFRFRNAVSSLPRSTFSVLLVRKVRERIIKYNATILRDLLYLHRVDTVRLADGY